MKANGKHSKETIQKIREASMTRVLPNTWKENVTRAIIERCAKPIICNETGKEFESISAAAEYYKVKPIQISRVCRGERYNVHGLSFSYISV